MSNLDLIIFGATGFTGMKTVMQAAKICEKYGCLSWGVAGRSQSKLENILSEASLKVGRDLTGIPVIVADVSDEKSLKDMCSRARIIVNCCGPYRFYGEPVVKAAVESKAHYVDVSGEPEFIEKMQLKYNEQAKAAGVYVISACGFDSIPNDMGVMFLKQNFGGTLNSVESYLSSYISPDQQRNAAIYGSVNYGTWESLVHSISNSGELRPLRQKLFPEKLPTFEPKLKPRKIIHKYNNKWCLPFPGADNSIVYRTQRHLYETKEQRPVQFKAYIKFSNFIYAAATMFAAVLLYVMCLTKFTRNLLLDHPRLFSFGMVTKSGPLEGVMNNTFFKFELVGEGWEGDKVEGKPNKKVVARVTGVNPGYGATVTALVWSALMVLKEHDKMPPGGGVLTTGAAFANTDLIKYLNEYNLKFEIVENEEKSK